MIGGTKALRAVLEALPGTILAGGYLRDTLYGKPPKDIDLFTPYRVDALERLKGMLLQADVEPWSWYCERFGIHKVIRVGGFELPVQVIVLAEGKSPVEDARQHDFSFCQVWHDGEFLQGTDAFRRDLLYSAVPVVTLEHCEDQVEFDRSMKRWERLSKKYHEYELIIPDRFAHFVPITGSVA